MSKRQIVIAGAAAALVYYMSPTSSDKSPKKSKTKSKTQDSGNSKTSTPSSKSTIKKNKKTPTTFPSLPKTPQQRTPHMMLSPPNTNASPGTTPENTPVKTPTTPKDNDATELTAMGKMVRSLSRTSIAQLSMSPTQRLRLEPKTDPSSTPAKNNKTSTTPSIRTITSKRNTDQFIGTAIGGVILFFVLFLMKFYSNEITEDAFGLFVDVLTFNRIPTTAQDVPAAIIAICISLPMMWLLDICLARPFFNSEMSQWFFLHSIANLFVVVGAVPDFYFASFRPASSLSVAFCASSSLPAYACSDWPTCIIVSVHIYHMLAFKLGSEDLFHHLTFVPIIGGGHFLYPWGLAGNLLCFFISGLPGMVDYFLLALYKDKQISSLTEKRINLSINVWLRSPGIVMFCCLTLVCWLQPPVGTPASDLMPWWAFFPAMGLIFYNGQYYGMRVIGNYYIRITQDSYSNITDVVVPRVNVELHAS